jgi:hypothetical protein
MRVFENGMMRRISGPKWGQVTGNGENYILKSIVICIRVVK